MNILYNKIKSLSLCIRNFIKRFSIKTERHIDYFSTINRLSDNDFDDFYQLMRKQLERLRDGLAQDHHYNNNNRREISQVKLAIKLLDIIMEDNGARLEDTNKPIVIKNENNEYISNPDNKWVFDKYVNTRNKKRFIGEFEVDDQIEGIFEAYLYQLKARSLFYEYLKNYSKNWWVL